MLHWSLRGRTLRPVIPIALKWRYAQERAREPSARGDGRYGSVVHSPQAVKSLAGFCPAGARLAPRLVNSNTLTFAYPKEGLSFTSAR